MSTTAIEWTDRTWNPLAGCNEISPGCLHCYAAIMAHRLAAMAVAEIAKGIDPGAKRKYIGTTKKLPSGKIAWTGKMNLDPDSLTIPLQRKAPTMYFVNSMSDLFHEDVPDEYIDQVFAVMALCPQHTFQVLTKRAERMKDYFAERYQVPPQFVRGKVDVWEDRESRVKEAACQMLVAGDFGNNDRFWTKEESAISSVAAWPLENVILGVSVENKKHGLPRIEHLRQTPAAVRMLSIEPLLEDLGQIDLTGIGWVIVGGESGPGASPMHFDWVYSIRDQCVAAGVPFFFKQIGEWMWGSDPKHQSFVLYGDGRYCEFTKEKMIEEEQRSGKLHDNRTATIISRVGKKAAGRLLDGRTWDEMPEMKAQVPA